MPDPRKVQLEELASQETVSEIASQLDNQEDKANLACAVYRFGRQRRQQAIGLLS